MKFTLESSYKLYNTEDRSYIEVCPDAEGLGLVEIRDVSDGGVVTNKIVMPPEQARLLVLAINFLLTKTT
jgi:hypothetical protein